MQSSFSNLMSFRAKLIVALILSIALMINNNNSNLLPFKGYFTSLLAPLQLFANIPSKYFHKLNLFILDRRALVDENNKMFEQNLLLIHRLQKVEHIYQENKRLRSLLGSSVHLENQIMVAEVVSVASDSNYQSVVLDKGSKQGVFLGQPVIDALGVLGQIVEVNYFTSRVLLITDESHGIPVRIARNDVRLVANGIGELDKLSIKYAPENTDVKEGDLLISSGLAKRFPEGYPVARVNSIKFENGQSKIMATPVAALDKIRYVLLLWPQKKEEAK